MILEIISTLIFGATMWLLGFTTGYVRGIREIVEEVEKKLREEE